MFTTTDFAWDPLYPLSEDKEQYTLSGGYFVKVKIAVETK